MFGTCSGLVVRNRNVGVTIDGTVEMFYFGVHWSRLD